MSAAPWAGTCRLRRIGVRMAWKGGEGRGRAEKGVEASHLPVEPHRRQDGAVLDEAVEDVDEAGLARAVDGGDPLAERRLVDDVHCEESGHTSQRPPGEREGRQGEAAATRRSCDREAGRRTRAVLREVVDGAHVALARGKVEQGDAPAEAEGEVRVVLLVQVPVKIPQGAQSAKPLRSLQEASGKVRASVDILEHAHVALGDHVGNRPRDLVALEVLDDLPPPAEPRLHLRLEGGAAAARDRCVLWLAERGVLQR